MGWYPGDWALLALPAFVLAAAGAVISIAVTRHDRAGSTAATVVALAPRPTASVPSVSGPKGRLAWPGGLTAWTVVLGSSPQVRGRARPNAIAARAVRSGLTEVGILDSSAYASLHPGYYVVFSGVYSAAADAETALQTARARGFGGAYQRRISP